MIDIEQPAMGLNSTKILRGGVQMWNTWDVAANKSASDIIESVRAVALSAPGGRLKNVVFHCHGAPGTVGIGRGIRQADLPLFTRWTEQGRPLVEKIWFRCCRVAYITPGPGGTGVAAGGDGNVFCSRLAYLSKAYVVASTETQVGVTGRILPFGKLDTFEGLVLSYSPLGDVTRSHRYPSTWPIGSDDWHDNPD